MRNMRSPYLRRRKDWRLFDLIIPLLVGSPFQGEHRDAQTPHLCEFRLAVESYYMIYFRLRPFEQISRAASHKV